MKTCPVCQATCFDDMETCFGCLHRFDAPSHQDGRAPAEAPSEASAASAFAPQPEAPVSLPPNVSQPDGEEDPFEPEPPRDLPDLAAAKPLQAGVPAVKSAPAEVPAGKPLPAEVPAANSLPAKASAEAPLPAAVRAEDAPSEAPACEAASSPAPSDRIRLIRTRSVPLREAPPRDQSGWTVRFEFPGLAANAPASPSEVDPLPEKPYSCVTLTFAL